MTRWFLGLGCAIAVFLTQTAAAADDRIDPVEPIKPIDKIKPPKPKDPKDKPDPDPKPEPKPDDKPKPQIEWLTDLDKAYKQAETDKKPVIAYFTFDACYWCKVLEKETFSDEKVVEESKKFIWVKLNKDHVPEAVKPFNVSAFPSLIVLGDKREKVHRFQSYQKPDEFMGNLKEGLRRHELYKKGEEWDEVAPRAAKICDKGKIETFEAPSSAVPAGIASIGSKLFVAQFSSKGDDKVGVQLVEVDAKTGVVKSRLALDNTIVDITSDGVNIYALPSGWTKGDPIQVIDPESGKVIRSITTFENKKNKYHAAKGIAWREGNLHVLDGQSARIHQVDPSSGEITESVTTGLRDASGLEWKGDEFVTGGREAIHLVSSTGKVTDKIDVNYPVRSVGWHDGQIIMMEQPVWGWDKEHKSIQLWPRPDKTLVYKLKLD